MSSSKATLPATHEVNAIVKSAIDLRSLPVLVLETERLMQDPRTSAQDIADLIARDPSIAARILKMANSSFYGFRRRIGNLTQAIVVLGFQAVKNLMLTVTVIDNFRSADEEGFDYCGFWAHSVASAIAAHEISRVANLPGQEDAYIAGLLHDIGKLIIAQNLSHLTAAIDESVAEGKSEQAAERKVLGRDHADIGGQLATQWNLPPNIAEAIRDHHTPRQDGIGGNLADALNLADILVDAFGLPVGGCDLARPITEPAYGLGERLGYDADRLASWVEGITTLLERASEFFEIIGTGPVRFHEITP